MERVDAAALRLQQALDRLEQALEARIQQNAQQGELIPADARAQDERERELQDALAAAKQENKNLHNVARAVSDRLDNAIGRLKQSVGS